MDAIRQGGQAAQRPFNVSVTEFATLSTVFVCFNSFAERAERTVSKIWQIRVRQRIWTVLINGRAEQTGESLSRQGGLTYSDRHRRHCMSKWLSELWILAGTEIFIYLAFYFTLTILNLLI